MDDTEYYADERRARIEQEARKRLTTRGIVDPLLNPADTATLFMRSRKYNEILQVEINAINASPCIRIPRVLREEPED